MSRGDYYEKQEAAVKVGHALERRGWKLFGWKENRSDAMTDYFDPESWVGVAVKGDYVACANVSAYDAKTYSGRPEIKLVPVPGEQCPRCSGSRVDPLGWTLNEARESPALFHTDSLRAEHLGALDRAETPSRSVPLPSGGEISWVLLAVSPLLFDDASRLKCRKCKGAGHLWEKPREEVLYTWPTFQANPRGKTWHVEKDGVILQSGTGLNRCYSINRERHEVAAAADELADRIEAATSQPPRPMLADGEGQGNAPTLTENRQRNGLELRFPGKPSETIRDEMKAHGWRWTKFGGCWYHRNTPANRHFAEALISRLTPQQASA